MITTRDCFGGLFPGWEQVFDSARNRYFYVDHNTQTTTWLNPADRSTKPLTVSECRNGELPYGWERVTDPTIGTYYVDHINKRNQWSHPVDDWHRRMSLNNHHYSNSHHIMEQSGHSLDSYDQTISPVTDKPDISFHSPDIEKSATSLNNSANLDSENIDTTRSNSSTRGSKYDAGLLDIMDNCYGRGSSQSVEV